MSQSEFPLEVFLDAAVLIDEPGLFRYSCFALTILENSSVDSPKLSCLFARLMSPYWQQEHDGPNEEMDTLWWNGIDTRENRLSRSIALLLAYEVLHDDPRFAWQLFYTPDVTVPPDHQLHQ